MDLVLKIMALVDENPSEPFSFERKQLELKLEEAVSFHTQQVDSELDLSYELGYDEGRYSAEEDYLQEIRELEEQVNDLEREIETLKEDNDKAFAEGYETASREVNVIETLKFE